jgi:glycerol kinase
MAKNTYGTGCFMLLNTGNQAISSNRGLLTTCAADSGLIRPGLQFALEGSVFIGGAVVQWLRDGLGIIKSSSDVERLAATVQDSGDVYLVPAFAGLGAPHWDPYARGAIVGLTRGSNRAHIARAALESIAFQSADLLTAMQHDAGIRLTELRADGGATSNRTLMQFQADLLGVPVVLSAHSESTAMGAAFLAGLSCGLWSSVDDIAGHWRPGLRFEPAMASSEAASRMARWQDAVHRSRQWVPAGEDC